MKFYEQKINLAKGAKSFLLGDEFFFVFTGKTIVIYNMEMKEIFRIQGLQYVYKGILSPDQSKLLAVSNSNSFYVISLADFSFKKYKIERKGDVLLEGRGCWTYDEKVIIPVFDQKKQGTELRVYEILNGMYTHIEIANRRVIYIGQVYSEHKYLLIEQNLDYPEDRHPLADTVLSWYDGKKFDTYHVGCFEDVVLNADLFELEKKIYLHGSEISIICDYYGNFSSTFQIDKQKEYTSLKRIVEHMTLSAEKRKSLNSIVEQMNMTNFEASEYIYNVLYSSNGKNFFVGTSHRIIAIDVETGEQIEKFVEYGVQKIVEIKNGTILIATWGGIRALTIQP